MKRNDPSHSKSGDERCREAKRVATKCYFLLDFYEDLFNDPEYSKIASIDRKAIAGALNQCHVPALNMAYRDLREEMEDLEPGDRAQLTHRLNALFDSDVEEEVFQEMLRAQEVVHKGRINDDAEYGLLRAYLEHNTERWGSSLFISRATEMVAEYERRMK